MSKTKSRTLKNTKFFRARQVPTFPVHHLQVGSLSPDGPSTDKFLKEALHVLILYSEENFDQYNPQVKPSNKKISSLARILVGSCII
jgi:hypothetical protein